jgi:hypothetical protein
LTIINEVNPNKRGTESYSFTKKRKKPQVLTTILSDNNDDVDVWKNLVMKTFNRGNVSVGALTTRVDKTMEWLEKESSEVEEDDDEEEEDDDDE